MLWVTEDFATEPLHALPPPVGGGPAVVRCWQAETQPSRAGGGSSSRLFKHLLIFAWCNVQPVVAAAWEDDKLREQPPLKCNHPVYSPR